MGVVSFLAQIFFSRVNTPPRVEILLRSIFFIELPNTTVVKRARLFCLQTRSQSAGRFSEIISVLSVIYAAIVIQNGIERNDSFGLGPGEFVAALRG